MFSKPAIFRDFRAHHLAFFLSFFLLVFPACAQHEDENHGDQHSEKFNAGETILHHVLDAHQVHFWDGFTLPLPIILYTDQGLDVFLSSNMQGPNHEWVPYTSPSTGNTYVNEHEHIYLANPDGSLMTEMVEGEEAHIAPLDLSITKNVFGLFLACLIMVTLFLSVAKGYKRNQGKAPKGVQSLLEPMILFIRDEVAKPSIGHHHATYMPFLLTIFFFIWIGNMLGLVPFLGGLNVTGNIGTTIVLAMFVFIITTVKANKAYWMHIVAPPGVPLWLWPIMFPIEVLGVFSKPIVLFLRLFANITAGHIIILSFSSLIFIFNDLNGPGVAYGVSVASVLFSVFMFFLELLVAFLQAYVFTLLSALYFGMATEEAHH